MMNPLVTTEWLADHLGDPDLVVVDSSWHMPSSGRSGRAEYLDAHIPGARFLDIDEVSDKSNPAPHMLPSAVDFGAAMELLGVGRDERIVVYDNSPVRTAARGWVTLRHFGADKVAILDGGFQKWLAEGRQTESGELAPRSARFDAAERPGEVVTKQQLLAGDRLAAARRPRQGAVRRDRAGPAARGRSGTYSRCTQPAIWDALPRGRDVPIARGDRTPVRRGAH